MTCDTRWIAHLAYPGQRYHWCRPTARPRSASGSSSARPPSAPYPPRCGYQGRRPLHPSTAGARCQGRTRLRAQPCQPDVVLGACSSSARKSGVPEMTQPPTILRQNGDSIFSGASAPSATSKVSKEAGRQPRTGTHHYPIHYLSLPYHFVLIGCCWARRSARFATRLECGACHACPIQVGHKIKAVAI